MMQIIHFTEGATDPLQEFRAQRARFVPLADGAGDTHVSCLYLEEGAQIADPPSTHDCTLLIVHGEVIYTSQIAPCQRVLAGMGLVTKAGEQYVLESEKGAIVLLIESDSLAANERGISSPQRIMGQRWPGEPDGYGGIYAYPRGPILEEPAMNSSHESIARQDFRSTCR